MIVPEEQASTPDIVFSVVLFPEPFDPMMETICPSSTLKETF
jgi:hypothetical protein